MIGRLRSFLESTRIFPWQRRKQHQTYEPTNDQYPMLATRHGNDNTSIEAPNDMLDQDSRRPKKKTWLPRYKNRPSGWRVAALSFAVWAAIVFAINLALPVSIFSTLRGGQDVLSEGDCGQIKRLNSGLHAMINILSTVLLSGSNYCMQCLSAPTRREVDVAHAKNKRLDIGIPSFRNLVSISRHRLVLWSLLGLSSVPLHLLYNSAVYASLSSNDYRVFMVSEAFLNSPCWNYTAAPNTTEFVLEDLWRKFHDNALDRLEPAQCLEQYATAIQTERRNLLLVASNDHFNQSERYPVFNDFLRPKVNITNSNVYWTDMFVAADAKQYGEAVWAYNWICSATGGSSVCSTRVDTIKQTPTTWHVGGGGFKWPVEYCLSEKAVPRCKLHFNLSIAIVVTILNFFKAALMFYAVYSIVEEPLMTIGDAVASFLEPEDPSTRNMCLLTVKHAKKDSVPVPLVWEDPQFRWRDTTSRARSIMNVSWLSISLIAVSVLLSIAIRQSGLDFATIMRLGFGAVDARTVISSEYDQVPTDTVSLTLIANLPQLVLSVIYFSYNAAFTAMLMGREWMSYARNPKGLRVSRTPIRDQRSTYFLQLPYRFGIPLVLLSGALHWLVSQSIFLVAIDTYDEYGRQGNPDYPFRISDWKTCGFSPVAMLVVVIVGCVMVVAIIGFGYVPYQRGMPLAGSSSIAISAACHSAEDVDLDGSVVSESKLQWGVVSTSVDSIGHCAFSRKKVDTLAKGQRYA